VKITKLHDYSTIGKALRAPVVPTMIYRKGKYVTIISSEDSYVWHTQLDYRRYKRLLRKQC